MKVTVVVGCASGGQGRASAWQRSHDACTACSVPFPFPPSSACRGRRRMLSHCLASGDDGVEHVKPSDDASEYFLRPASGSLASIARDGTKGLVPALCVMGR